MDVEPLMKIQFKKDLIYQQLRKSIYNGKYPPGMKLPKETEFASQLGVAFMTLRSALKQLEDDKLITRLRSRGTFVNDLPSPTLQDHGKILVLFPEVDEKEGLSENVFNRHLALGISGQCGLMHMGIMVEYIRQPGKLLARYLNGEFAAIVWDRPTDSHTVQAIRQLTKAKVPQVIVNRTLEGIPSVSCDYPSAIRQAVHTLQGIGHRHIALIDIGDGIPIFRERRKVFLKEITKSGITDPRRYVIPFEGVAWNDWYNHIAESMLRIPDTTAVIVLANFMRNFAEYLSNAGIAVPERLSVIQWGERLGFESNSQTPYSVLTEPRSAIGREVVGIVRKMLAGENCTDLRVMVSGELKMRNGCALPWNLRNSVMPGAQFTDNRKNSKLTKA